MTFGFLIAVDNIWQGRQHIVVFIFYKTMISAYKKKHVLLKMTGPPITNVHTIIFKKKKKLYLKLRN